MRPDAAELSCALSVRGTSRPDVVHDAAETLQRLTADLTGLGGTPSTTASAHSA